MLIYRFIAEGKAYTFLESIRDIRHGSKSLPASKQPDRQPLIAP